MLLIYSLVFFIVALLAFSLSKETGKNTKYARRGANAIAHQPKPKQNLISANPVELN